MSLCKKVSFLVIVLLISVCLISTRPAFAASSTLSVSPASGSYGKTFTADIVIDGHGDTFNAAQSVVTLSSNLAISNVVLGNCNFSFLRTPSTTDPSFAGVLLGKSATTCTVYTMTLVPTQKGTGSITLAKGTVQRYGDGKNILSSLHNATFTLTGEEQTSSVVSMQTNTASPSGNLYAVSLNIQGADKKPLSNAQVSLVNIASKKTLHATTNASGIGSFTDLTSGIYDAKVVGYAGENILNISGPNHTLVLGINVSQQQGNQLPQKQGKQWLPTSFPLPLLIGGVLLMGVLLGGGVFAAIFFFLKRGKN